MFEIISKLSYRLDFEIEGVPTAINVFMRQNRYARNTENKNWYAVVKMKLKELRCPLPPKPLAKANLTFIRYSFRTLDYDGLVGSFKPIADALKHAGIILDDKWKVTGPWNVTQEFRPKSEGNKIRIIVEEFSEESK